MKKTFDSKDFLDLLQMDSERKIAQLKLKELRKELRPKPIIFERKTRPIAFSYFQKYDKKRKPEGRKIIYKIWIIISSDSEFNAKFQMSIHYGNTSANAFPLHTEYTEELLKINFQNDSPWNTFYILKKRDFLYLKQTIEEIENEFKAIIETLERI